MLGYTVSLHQCGTGLFIDNWVDKIIRSTVFRALWCTPLSVEYVNKIDMKTINVDGVEYVKKSDIKTTTPAKSVKGLTYCIVRTYSAGVWAGYVDLKKVNEIMTVTEARRLWRWWSEFTLSALATTGMREDKKAENKYAMPVSEVHLTNVIEIIPCTEVAKEQIIAQPNYFEK